jgi:hypothetical protein
MTVFVTATLLAGLLVSHTSGAPIDVSLDRLHLFDASLADFELSTQVLTTITPTTSTSIMSNANTSNTTATGLPTPVFADAGLVRPPSEPLLVKTIVPELWNSDLT